MEDLFKDAFIRGVNYVLFHQKLKNKQLSEEDFFGPDGRITNVIMNVFDGLSKVAEPHSIL